MPKKAKSLSEIISTEKEFDKIRKMAASQRIVDDFENILPDLSAFAKAVKFDNGVLYLNVENSVWRSELQFNQKKLIEKINNYLEDEAVKSIKFVK